MNSKNFLLRYEFKYLLNSELSKKLLNESLNFMKKDSNVLKDERGYLVRSLYYDNNDYDNFYEKVDGQQLRKKFRLRTYSNKFDKKNSIFLELKGKTQDRVIKKRLLIDYDDLEKFYKLTDLNSLIKKYKNDLINQFFFEVCKKKIKPKIIVDYKRVPLINKYGLYFRLTFDSDLETARSSKLFNEKNFIFSQRYKPGYTILEVKFERSIPIWFHRIIQTYDLRRKSISKFVIGICNCGIREETSD